MPKTEAAYKSIVGRLAKEMRLSGDLPYEWLADNTRWMRKPTTWPGAEAVLKRTARSYRQALWDQSDEYVEIWLEKDAIAGVIFEETAKWDVPLMVTRGYPSLSFVYSAAEAITAMDRPTWLYYWLFALRWGT